MPLAIASENQLLITENTLSPSATGIESVLIPCEGCAFTLTGLCGYTTVSQIGFWFTDASGADLGSNPYLSGGIGSGVFQTSLPVIAGAVYCRKISLVTSAACLIHSLTLNMTGAGISLGSTLAGYLLQSNPMDDLATYVSDFVAFRPVGLSALTTYRGPALQGGYVATRRFNGVEPPSYSLAPALPYTTLSTRAGAYDGVVNTGSYTFWLPQDPLATTFRPVLTEEDNFSRGYMAIAGLTSGGAGSIRIRVAFAVEAITYKQKYSPSASLVSPSEIAHALLTLSSMPSAMPNDSHWDNIKSMLRSGAKRAAQKIWDNRSAASQMLAGSGNPQLSAIGKIIQSI